MSFFADQIVGTAVGVLTVDASGVVQGTDIAQRSLRTFSEETVALSRGFETLGRITGVAGVAIVGSLAAASREFINFETKVKDIESLGGTSAEQMERLTDSILGLSVEMGKSPTELADALYNVASAGFSVEDSLEIVTAASKAAVAGLTTVATAADLISSILLSYGLAAEQATYVSNVLFATVQIGRVRFEELARTMGTLTPTARGLNVSLEELGAGMASLTNQGLSARQAAFQLNSLMQTLIKPSKALAAAMAEFGIESFQAFIAANGLSGALDFLNTISGNNATTLQKLLGNQRATRAALILSAQSASEYNKALLATTNAQDGAGATQRAFEKQTEAVSFQLKQAQASAQVLGITIGSVLAPGIALAAKFLASLAQTATAAFNLLPDTLQSVVVYIGAATGAGLLLISALAILQATALRAAEAMLLFSKANQQAAESSIAAGGAAQAQARGLRASLRQIPKVKTIQVLIILAGLTLIAKQIEALFTGIANQTTVKAQQVLLQGLEGLVKAWNASIGRIPGLSLEGFDDRIDDLQAALDAQEFVIKAGLTVEIGDKADEFTVKELGMTFDELKAAAERANTSIEEYIRIQADLRGITLENADAAGEAADNTAEFTQETQAAEQAAAEAAREYEDLTGVIDSLGKKVPEATAAFKQAREDAGLTLPLTATADAFKDFVEDLNRAIDAMYEANDVIHGMDEPLAFLRGQLGLTGDTVGETFEQLQDLGFGLDFDASQQEVLALQGDIEDVNQILEGLGAAVANNNDDMAMWQGYISLVDDTLGDHTNTLEEYKRQLEAGEITQEEFNRAVESGKAHIAYQELNRLVEEGLIPLEEANDIRDAANWLIERSVGGLEDERVEQARLLPLIAEYVARHDELLGKQADLSNEQKAFLGLLQDQGTQSALNTVQMLSYLASIGQIPKEKVTEVVMNLAQSDPALAALFSDLGLLQQGVDIPVTVTMDEAQQRLHDIQVQRDALLAQKAQLQVQLAADPNNVYVQEQIRQTDAALTELDGRQANLSVAIDSNSQTRLETAIEADKALVAELDNTGANIPMTFDTTGLEDDPEVRAVVSEIAGLYAELANLPADAIASAEDGKQKLDEIRDRIAEIDALLAEGYRIDEFGIRVKLDENDIKELEAEKAELTTTSARIQVRMDSADFDATAIAIQQQIDGWEEEGATIVARIRAEDEEEGLQSLEEARRAIQDRMGQLNLANPEDAQLYAQLQGQLQAINQLLQQGHEINFTVEGEERLRIVADLLETTANPAPRVVEVQTAGQEHLNALNAEIARVDGSLDYLRVQIENGVDGALEAANEQWYRFIQLGQQKILFEMAVNPTAAAQTAQDFDALADDLEARNDRINAYLAANPGMDQASVEAFNAELEQNAQTIAQLRGLALIPLVLETGDSDAALATIDQMLEDLVAEWVKLPLGNLTPDQTQRLDEIKAMIAVLEGLRATVDNLQEDADGNIVLDLQANVSQPGDPAGAAVYDAATGGAPLGTVPIEGRVDIDTTQVAEAQDLIADTQNAVAGFDGVTGKVVVDASDMDAVFDFIDENNISSNRLISYTFRVDDQELSGLDVTLINLLRNAGLTEAQVADLTDGFKNLAQGFAVELDFDGGDVEASIDRLREYMRIFSEDVRDDDGEYALQIRGNADELFAILTAINPAINEAQLNRNLLITLDANNDGFLNTLELSRIAAQNIEDDPFFAHLYMDVVGDEDLYRRLNDVENVAVELSEDSHTVHITAETDEDYKRFLDENAGELAGKDLVVTIVGEDGVENGIESIEEFHFTPKTVPLVLQTTTAELELRQFIGATAAVAADGVTIDVQADSTDAAAEFLRLNREELDGKPVRVYVRDQATGDLVLLDSYTFDAKDVPVNATDNVTPVVDDLTREEFNERVIQIPIVGSVVPGTGLDDAGGNVAQPTTTVTADNSPALQTASETPAAMQTAIDTQPQPEAEIRALVNMDAVQTSADEAAGGVEGAQQRIVGAIDAIGTEGQPRIESAAGALKGAFDAQLAGLDDVAQGRMLAAIQVVSTLQNAATGYGRNLGIYLTQGMARGIQEGVPGIELWAQFAALRAYGAAARALGIRSPSAKGAYIGDMFTLGMLQSLQAGEDPLVAQARRLAGSITDEFDNATARPMTFTGLAVNAGRTPVAVDGTMGNLAAARQAAIVNQRSMGNFQPQIFVNGSGDPTAVGQEVFRLLHSAARRFVAGGGAMEA
jgi:TP901 family phage tail tape measure protein